ncbi:hypothetical protein [Sphingobium sp. B2]|nr:hypothetical protein [Sphingobium sp. B2]
MASGRATDQRPDARLASVSYTHLDVYKRQALAYVPKGQNLSLIHI